MGWLVGKTRKPRENGDNMMTTPFEKAGQFAKDMATSFRLSELLKEIEKIPPEQRDTPENKALIDLVYALILSAPLGDIAEG